MRKSAEGGSRTLQLDTCTYLGKHRSVGDADPTKDDLERPCEAKLKNRDGGRMKLSRGR